MAEQKQQQVAQVKKDVSALVLSRVNEFVDAGALKLPKDYSPENALKAAYIVLNEVKDRNGKPALEVCTQGSIAEALLKMVVWGVSPLKKQCYFIPYGDKLECTLDYSGNILLAKRYGGLKEINANVIYDGENPLIEIDAETGRMSVKGHTPTLKAMSLGKIVGAYAVCQMNDGTTRTEVMTMDMIKNSWMQGAAKGNSPAHQKFSDQMAKKTVINRACKLLIRASDDSALFVGDETEEANEDSHNSVKEDVKQIVKQRQAKSFVDVDDVEFETVEEQSEPQQKEEPKAEEVQPKEPAGEKKPKAEPKGTEQEELFAEEQPEPEF